MKQALKLSLPYPPSINNYYGRNRFGSVYIKAAGKAYRKTVIAKFGRVKPMLSKLSVKIFMYPPDKRKRDVDNVLKASMDALQAANIFKDDSQIYRLLIEKCEPKTNGELYIEIQGIGKE